MPIKKEFTVKLDLKRTTGNRDFTLVAGDTGNVIRVTLTDDGVPVDLTGCRVLAVFTKPTGSSMQDSAIENGGVTIGGAQHNVITLELFGASFATGTNACELQIYSGDDMGVLVTSAAFNFYCRNGIIDDGTILSTDEYPLLTALIRQVEALLDSVITPSDVDAALSQQSANPVKNSVVTAALAGKAPVTHTHAAADVTGLDAALLGAGTALLGTGTALLAGASMDALTVPGVYSADAAVAATLTHAPCAVAFKCYVHELPSALVLQYALSAACKVYMRTFDGTAFSAWSSGIEQVTALPTVYNDGDVFILTT